MILVRSHHSRQQDRYRWHIFEREDATGRWRSACGRRFGAVDFMVSHPTYLDCKKCQDVHEIRSFAA